MKKLLGIVLVVVMLMVACDGGESTEEKLSTTQYLTNDGKQAVEMCREYEYTKLDMNDPWLTNYEDEKVEITGTVDGLWLREKGCSFILEVEDNHSAYPLKVYIPSTNVDIEFEDGEEITVKGRFCGIITEEGDGGKPFDYCQINAYVLEK